MNEIKHPRLDNLTRAAVLSGASAAAVIESDAIRAKEDLALMCNGEYACPNYGNAASCPPHVGGPDQFRAWQAQSEYALVVKIDVPTAVMFSDERLEVMRLLHHIVSGIEHDAVEMGFKRSKAFAGGSCKDLFCQDQSHCCVVQDNKSCRHASLARPSMSGFGIDVSALMKLAGWSGAKAEKSGISDPSDMTWVAGLILIA